MTRRYDRIARLYDVYDTPMKWMGTRTRHQRLLSKAAGRVLEVGVGTGRNLSRYQEGVTLTGIDVSGGMLTRPRRRADRLSLVELESADVHQLPYPDATFDTAVATATARRHHPRKPRSTRPGCRSSPISLPTPEE